jgi:hypothetical protein
MKTHQLNKVNIPIRNRIISIGREDTWGSLFDFFPAENLFYHPGLFIYPACDTKPQNKTSKIQILRIQSCLSFFFKFLKFFYNCFNRSFWSSFTIFSSSEVFLTKPKTSKADNASSLYLYWDIETSSKSYNFKNSLLNQYYSCAFYFQFFMDWIVTISRCNCICNLFRSNEDNILLVCSKTDNNILKKSPS